jgi:hypothetical protein
MPIRRRLVSVISAAVLVLSFTSCNNNPTSPPPVPTGQPPTTTVTVVRLELVAPPEIDPGESVQLTANAVKSDGSVENVSSQAQWSPTNSQIVQLSSTGLATGRNRGEVFVSARFANRFANARIFVLPRGTFRIQGVVNETGFGISGVTVSVISGVGEGLTTTSGFGGFYALYGVSGAVQIHTKMDGYLNGIHQVNVTAHGTRDLDIVADRARSDYRGNYELTISVTSPCRFNTAVLPDAAKRRVYTASIVQNGAVLTVTLSGADFVVVNGRGRSFTGFVDVSGGVRFVVGDAFYYYYYYGGNFDIAERISDFTLLFSGIANVVGTPDRLAGGLEGSIVTSRNTARPFSPFLAQCHGSVHGFELVRR